MRHVRLTEADIIALKALKLWVAMAENSRHHGPGTNAAFLKELVEREEALPDAARQAWSSWKNKDFMAELGRWRHAFYVEKTSQGYRVYRWIKNRGEYARRALKTRLDAAGAAPYRDRLIRV